MGSQRTPTPEEIALEQKMQEKREHHVQTFRGRLFTIEERRRILKKRDELYLRRDLGMLDVARLLANEIHLIIGEKMAKGEAIIAPSDHETLELAKKLLQRRSKKESEHYPVKRGWGNREIAAEEREREREVRRSIWEYLRRDTVEDIVDPQAERYAQLVAGGSMRIEDAEIDLLGEIRYYSEELTYTATAREIRAFLNNERRTFSQIDEFRAFLKERIKMKAEAIRRQSDTRSRRPEPPRGGGGEGPTSGGDGLPPEPPAGGPRSGSYYEDDIKSAEAAKRAFFEGDRDRAIEILTEIGWDKEKIGNALEKWKKEFEVTENAEKVYFEGDPKGAAQILKNELKWNNEKIRKAQLRWERQSTYGRMMTEQRGPETFKGKPVASYVPEEFAEKFNRSKLSRPAPKTSAIIADLEALWEETIETK